MSGLGHSRLSIRRWRSRHVRFAPESRHRSRRL